jgi:hypothetical protein
MDFDVLPQPDNTQPDTGARTGANGPTFFELTARPRNWRHVVSKVVDLWLAVDRHHCTLFGFPCRGWRCKSSCEDTLCTGKRAHQDIGDGVHRQRKADMKSRLVMEGFLGRYVTYIWEVKSPAGLCCSALNTTMVLLV